ncbi:MAG: TIGR02449 family protein [Pseudomonadota bacterium]
MTIDAAQASEAELKKLEARIDEMIRTCERLKEENTLLRKQYDALLSEQTSLAEKNQQARARVELIIQRLKSLEQET